jgi:hypothetical protein
VYRISGIGVTRGWESLRNEVPGTENPKVPKVPKTEVSKKKKKTKSAEPNESSENPLESKCLLFLFVLVINVVDCS